MVVVRGKSKGLSEEKEMGVCGRRKELLQREMKEKRKKKIDKKTGQCC